MKKKKTFIIVVMLLAVLLLGIGYAVISNTNLYITGTASATADSNFEVVFDQDTLPITSSESNGENVNVEATVTDEKNATISVSGLTTKGDTATATYTILNNSEDLTANLSAEVTENTKPEYFNVEYEFAEPTVASMGQTTVTVTVTLLKTPVTAEDEQNAQSNIKLTITAEPIQPQQ